MNNKKYIIGIDLGGTNLKLALLSVKYKIITKKILSTKKFKSSRELTHAIVSSVDELIRARRIKKTRIAGLGIGLPGPVDARTGIVRFLPNIPGWRNIRLGEILTRRLKLPVFIDNDANLFTLAEYRLGAGKGLRNIVGITLGTGVGGGLIIEGRLYRGESFAAGEAGHIPILLQGRPCNCGGRGCLEAYVGNKRILSWAEKVFKKRINLEELSNLAARGEHKAIRIWQSVGYLIGSALTGVINLLNPDALVIGGGVSNSGRVLFNSIRNFIKKNAMAPQARQVVILKSKFKDDAGLIGAAILVRECKLI